MRDSKKTVRDMTVGSPFGHIFIFAVPLFLGNLFQQFYNMVDSLVVGNYVGKNAVAAVGACSSLNFLCFALSSGLAVGIGIIVAQYYGAKDETAVKQTIANGIFVLFGASIVVSILGIIFAPWVLTLMETPQEIIGDSITYMRTTCAGIICIAAYNGIASVLRALGDSKTPLYFLILSSIVNVVLDLVFVIRFDMGVLGVAVATIIAQAVSAVSCMIYAYNKFPYFKLTKEELKPNKTLITQAFRLGTPIAFQNSLIAISCAVLQSVVNTYGSTIVAAFSITSRLEQVIHQPFSSLAMAMTTYTGQNVGAGEIDRVKKGLRVTSTMAIVCAMIVLPVAFFFGEPIIGCFLDDPEVISIGAKAFRITSLFYVPLGLLYVTRGVLNGAGDTQFAMINGMGEVGCRIVFAPLLTAIPAIGFWGIWGTSAATWGINYLICYMRYVKGIWKVKAIVTKKRETTEG